MFTRMREHNCMCIIVHYIYSDMSQPVHKYMFMSILYKHTQINIFTHI